MNRHAYAVIDIETNDVMSRHRTIAAARRAQDKYGPPSKVKYTTRPVGRGPEHDPVTHPPVSREVAIADAFTERAMNIVFGKMR